MPVQTATIVVTDLVASTPLRTALGEERAEEIRRAHDRALTAAAEAGGGTVVKHLGDGLLVLFAGSAEALSAAIAMQQALEVVRREERVDLTMRVGVSAGDVTLEAGDCFGTPVVEASRLADTADGEQILVAEQVRLLARGRGGLDLDPVGAMELKGLSEPIDVWSLRWTPVRTRADLRTETPFVGRSHERALLAERAAIARDGHGGLLLVTGDPGIGKTRIVRELCDEMNNTTVLWGGCHDGEVLAYAPFVEAFTSWFRAVGAGESRAMLGAEEAVLARVVPIVHGMLTDDGEVAEVPPDEAAAQLHDAVTQVLGRMAARGPVVLVVDDLHWADDATVAMLRAIARGAVRTAVLVIGTYRETDLERRHPLARALPLLRRETDVMRIELAGLVTGEIQILLQRLTGQDVSEQFSAVISRHTEGNPFFVRETLLSLVESGRVRFEDGAWTSDPGDLEIPEGVREVIRRRLSQLSEATNQLLHAAALFDVAFPFAETAEVAQLADDAALDAVDEALEARVIRATDTFDQYAFTHALFRQTLVEELNPSRQVRLHRFIAETLEKSLRGEPTPEQAAALIRHFERSAAVPGAERAVRYALVVADDAVRRGAYRQEYDVLVVARELDPEWVTADVAARIVNAAALAEIAPDLLADEVERAGELIAAAEGADRAADILAGALDAGYQLIEPTARWRIAAIARRWLGPNRRDVTWVSLRAMELNERDVKDPTYPGVLVDDAEWREVRRVALEHYGDIHLANTSRYVGPISRNDIESLKVEESSRRWALRNFGSYGDYRQQRDAMLASLDEPATRRNVPRLALTLVLTARLETVLGLHDEAIAHLADASELLPRLLPEANEAFQVLSAIAMRAYMCGDDVSLLDIEALERLAENPDTRWAATVIWAGKAVVLAREGASDDAIAALEACLPGIERAPGWVTNYPMIVGFAAAVLFRAERTDHLEVIEHNLRTKVLEPDFRYPETDSRWSLALLCAVSGRTDEARLSFTEARLVLTEEGLTPLLVALDFDEATMELRAGDSARARELLVSARAGCTHPSMAPWVARLDELESKL